MAEDHLDRLVAQYQSELNHLDGKKIEAIAHYESVCHSIFVDPDVARTKMETLFGRIGPNDTFTVIERGGIFDYRSRTWISLRHNIGETRAANQSEVELAERSLYEAREAWMDLDHHTRQYDKVERQLRLVLEEKARRAALNGRATFAGGQENTRANAGRDLARTRER